jgi:hypothetical protein
MPIASETELYRPVKAFFERLGYDVRAEVRNCDLVAMRGQEEPVIVELKKTFNLPLVIQGLDRQRSTSRVYLAVEQKVKGRAPHNLKWSELTGLCRKLGLGLITVRFYKSKAPFVDILCDPEAAAASKAGLRTARLVSEFRERSGDYNIGGSRGTKLVTAYREKALHCAHLLREHGPLTTRALRELTANGKVSAMMQENYYRWFSRVSRGTYTLTPLGEAALSEYGHVIAGKLAGTPMLPAVEQPKKETARARGKRAATSPL